MIFKGGEKKQDIPRCGWGLLKREPCPIISLGTTYRIFEPYGMSLFNWYLRDRLLLCLDSLFPKLRLWGGSRSTLARVKT